MTLDDSLHCRLEINGYGTPPLPCLVEARKLARGFAVWLQHEHEAPDGVELARAEAPYSAREFARVILELRISARLHPRWESGPDCSDGARAVSVTGESGLKAHLLRLASTVPLMTDWLMEQSDASLAFLEGFFDDASADYWYTPFSIIIEACAADFYVEADILGLFRRHGLPASRASLPELQQALLRSDPQVKQEREVELQRRIAPFRAEIDAMAAKFSDRIPECLGWRPPSARGLITWFLEKYVVAHRRIPQGRFYVNYAPLGRYCCDLGPVDFDKLRTMEEWIPYD